MPPNMHLVIATERIYRWHVCAPEQLTELRAADLRFNAADPPIPPSRPGCNWRLRL
jgi:hypothetical protein